MAVGLGLNMVLIVLAQRAASWAYGPGCIKAVLEGAYCTDRVVDSALVERLGSGTYLCLFLLCLAPPG